MNTIQEIFKWYEQYDNTDILIQTLNEEFYLNINNRSLPHLLGMQYATKNNLNGRKLYNFIKNKTDEEIFSLISENKPKMLHSVKERINNFRFFMENLEKAIVYNKTKEATDIKSEFLLVKVDENKYLQLGIGRDKNYEDYFETFFVRKDDNYFKDSKIKEPILSILKYGENLDLVPFSFNENKNIRLSNIEYSLSDDNFKELLKNIDFNNLDEITYENFNFYPLVNLDKNFLENGNFSEISKFCEIDNMNNNFLKSKNLIEKEKVDEYFNFYKSVPEKYKETDLFFCKETRNVYIPTNSGLMKYTKYKEDNLLKTLKDNFTFQIDENLKNKEKENLKNLNLELKLSVIDFVNKRYKKEIDLSDFENLCKDITKVKLIDEIYNKHNLVYELDLKDYKSNIFVDNQKVFTKEFLKNSDNIDYSKLKEEIQNDLNSLDFEFVRNSMLQNNIYIDDIQIDEYLEKNNDYVLEKDMDNDGVIDRFDADFRDSKVQTIGQLEEREQSFKRL